MCVLQLLFWMLLLVLVLCGIGFDCETRVKLTYVGGKLAGNSQYIWIHDLL